MIENELIEFKRQYTPALIKDVIAFVNSTGGTLYIGIDDHGDVVGVDDIDDTMLRVTNLLKDNISPDVIPFIHVDVLEKDDKHVVRISVTRGTNRPYYNNKKGLMPQGVYSRIGSSSQPVSEEMIRMMIMQSMHLSFEEQVCIYQNLSFDSFHHALKQRNISLSEENEKTLYIKNLNGEYTNLAWILSDQNIFTTKVALFRGIDKLEFQDRKEFTGSLFQQLDDVHHYLSMANKKKATFKGLYRTDTMDYPEDAMKEAMLNCFVHRDYSMSTSIIINIYDNRIEFVSPGGIVPSIELKSIFLGASNTRNPHLSSILYRMELIESYGSGVMKIQKSYEKESVKPLFECAKGVFRVTLPNVNEIPEEKLTRTIQPIQDELNIILEYAKHHGYVTRLEVENLLSIKTTKAYSLLKDLCISNRLKEEGQGRSRIYRII